MGERIILVVSVTRVCCFDSIEYVLSFLEAKDWFEKKTDTTIVRTENRAVIIEFGVFINHLLFALCL